MSKETKKVTLIFSAEEISALQRISSISEETAVRILLHRHMEGEDIESKIARAIGPLVDEIFDIRSKLRV
ncbi:hypothetical protein EHN06_20940 (plasmid) [Marinobacter sp. NP-4(2019)]|uniref:hypothetical protein n=1 Tax=Marinobacter sp. NP-4(2019) TaxID=2488665 RepID=UPI000FC3EE6A|nr:hypothetical protein [Marinobacter sp. NP-4(2019)]AZT86084.1 hypothetical protein EHN06_20940 [Marinobacter sp. NP-4(2019)]